MKSMDAKGCPAGSSSRSAGGHQEVRPLNAGGEGARMRRWLDGATILTLVAAVATFGMMILTTADTFGRYLFNRPILAAYELTTNYLIVAAIFLAMPTPDRQGANIR